MPGRPRGHSGDRSARPAPVLQRPCSSQRTYEHSFVCSLPRRTACGRNGPVVSPGISFSCTVRPCGCARVLALRTACPPDQGMPHRGDNARAPQPLSRQGKSPLPAKNNKSSMMFIEAIKGKKVKLEIENYYV